MLCLSDWMLTNEVLVVVVVAVVADALVVEANSSLIFHVL